MLDISLYSTSGKAPLTMLQNLGESPSPEKYRHCAYKLKWLQQLRLGIEDKSCQFLQRA